jgi:hypothetical protein
VPVAAHAGALVARRYRLQHKLLDSATSITWQALDTALGRSVRLEILRPEVLGDAAAAEAFRHAMREAARAASPTAKVLDGGDDPETGLPFVVYELPAPVADRQTTRPIVRPRQRRRIERLIPAVLLLIPLIGGVALIANWLAQPASPVSTVLNLPRPTAAPTAAAKPTPAATPAPSKPTAVAAKPTATAAPELGERRRVANTDGIGVALRDGPDGQRQPGKGYDEGAVVTLLEQQGRWSRIRGDDGREGWVLSVTLVR